MTDAGFIDVIGACMLFINSATVMMGDLGFYYYDPINSKAVMCVVDFANTAYMTEDQFNVLATTVITAANYTFFDSD